MKQSQWEESYRKRIKLMVETRTPHGAVPDLVSFFIESHSQLLEQLKERIEKQKPDRIIGQYQNVGNSDDGFVGTKELLDKKTVLAIISDLQKESK